MSEWSKDYSDRGIERDTFACVAVASLKDAKKYAFDLLASGTEVKVMKDADGKRWHVAVRGGMAGTPMTFIVSVRGEPFEPMTCVGVEDGGQHPMKEEA